jgi:virginiamycin B lyase
MDWRCSALVAVVVPVIAQLSAIPFTQLKPDTVIALGLTRGASVSADGVWIPNPETRAIVRIDATNNTPDKPIQMSHAPCASTVVVGDELLTPLCGGSQLARVNIKHRNVSATMPLSIAEPEGSVAVSNSSVWIVSDVKGVVTRLDVATETPVAEVYLASKPFAIAADEDAVWVTSEEGNVVTRVNPRTNVVVEAIEVGPRPGPLAIGEGAVWTLNRGDGSVSRVDVKTNKVVNTIKIDESVATGSIAVGEGAVWLSAPGVPLVRIDVRTNRVTHRFTGDGGGAVLVGHGSVWVNAGARETWRLDPKLVAATRGH